MAHAESDLQLDILGIVKRRKWIALAVMLSLSTIAAAVALFWPPAYRSEATILIEEPDVPAELVKSTVSSFADERLQVIQQRVMTTQNLVRIINKFGLYAKEKERQPTTVIVEQMRNLIKFGLVSTDIRGAKGAPRATIAFTVGFEDRVPRVAQQVANELVTLYLSENLQTRKDQAAGTTGFLAGESRKLYQRLQELEKMLADFKSEHAGRLPEQLNANAAIMERSLSELMGVRQQIQSVEQRRILLESQLAQINPYSTQAGNQPGPAERLRQLQTQLVTMSARYDPSHPDVVKVKREVDALQKTVGGPGAVDLGGRLQQLQDDLTASRQRYGSQHPDVRKIEREIATVRAAISNRANNPTPQRAAAPDNPPYIQMQAQIKVATSDMVALRDHANLLTTKIADMEQRVLQMPEVERAYLGLRREYDETTAKYKEIRNKEGEAVLAESLEAEAKSERFSVIEPPVLPEKPSRPNRPVILAVGFLVAAMAGIGSGALVDLLDGRVHGQRLLTSLVGQAPLVVVPRIRNAREVRRRRLQWAGGAAGAIALALAIIVYVHFAVAPLDVVMSMVANRFAL